jgi:hypothetical protein
MLTTPAFDSLRPACDASQLATRTATRQSASEILGRIRISEIWRALGGGELRHGRGVAWWRRGGGCNVSLNDVKSTWYDHAAGEGGGVLGLVALVRGGTRTDALRWCADLAGIPLTDTPLSAADRARWAAERRELECHLPAALHWRRGAVNRVEGVLMYLKAGLFDPMVEQPAPGEITEWTRDLARLNALTGAALVDAYRTAMKRDLQSTAGMVRRARQMERSEIRALLRLMRMTPAEWAALPVTEWQP